MQEHVLAGTTLTAAEVKAAFLNADLKERDVMYERPLPLRTRDAGQRGWHIRVEAAGKLEVLRNNCKSTLKKQPKRARCQANLLDRLLWIYTTTHVASAYHVDDSLIVGTLQSIIHLFIVLSTDLEIVSNEMHDKLTMYLDRTLAKTASGYSLGSGQRHTSETDAVELPEAEQKLCRQLAGKFPQLDRAGSEVRAGQQHRWPSKHNSAAELRREPLEAQFFSAQCFRLGERCRWTQRERLCFFDPR